MHRWQIVIAVVTAALAWLFLVGFVVYLWSYLLGGRRSKPGPARQRIGALPDEHVFNGNNNNRLHGQYSFSVEAFCWDHHPSFLAEILEHGWTTFAFTYNCFDKNSPRPWGLCRGLGAEPEITWEAISGSNLQQKIRLDPGSASSEFMSLHTALPLPGPALRGLGFPQESYFEITIISEGSSEAVNNIGFEDDDDRVNLLQLVNLDRCDGSVSEIDEGPILSNGGRSNENVSGVKTNKKGRVIAVGQGAFGSCACTMPGLEPGSLGFYSTGAVLLNGQRHRGEEEVLHTWGAVGSVIGCGFDPATRCVFFTLNGARVRTVISRTVEFGSPLYPTIAANYDVTVLVNFGQQSFCYADANSGRVCDPCSLNCLEDSREFFSMERIDPLWFADKMGWQEKNVGEAEESDLFEIVLDVDNITPL